jgi:ribosomal protein S1
MIPWAIECRKPQGWNVVEAIITNLTKFGAFAKVQDDIEDWYTFLIE